MAAFKASRLVWSAMSLISPTTLATLSNWPPSSSMLSASVPMDWAMLLISLVVDLTTSALASEEWPLSSARRWASLALSDRCWMETVNSSIVAAMVWVASLCRPMASSTCRELAIMSAAVRVISLDWRLTPPRVSARCFCISPTFASKGRPASDWTSAAEVRSPWPMRSASLATWALSTASRRRLTAM